MKTSKQFYTELTPKNLALRKKPEYTRKELNYLKKILTKKQKVLDLGCGYGRFAIPLKKQGYNIEGIDITPVLIKKARQDARKQHLKINFKIGDMRKLPYNPESFDVILCMWSAFSELIKKSEQLKALREMIRVLKKKGFSFIEMPVPIILKEKQKIIEYKKEGDKLIFKKDNPITTGRIANIETMPTYRNNKQNLTKLMKELKIKKFKIFKDNFGGRTRFFLKFYK